MFKLSHCFEFDQGESSLFSAKKNLGVTQPLHSRNSQEDVPLLRDMLDRSKVRKVSKPPKRILGGANLILKAVKNSIKALK